MSLQITQAKPNPAGKGSGASAPEQLLGEWVDVKNVGNDSVRFSTIQLRHSLFDERCHATGLSELYWQGGNEDFLKPGQVLRIHAGRQIDSGSMPVEDQTDSDWHGYTEAEEFMLNVGCGDKIIAAWRDAFDRSFQDWVCYAPHPPEGAILTRSGNRLTATGVAVSF